MNHFKVVITLNDGYQCFRDCPTDLDMRLINDDATFISIPDFAGINRNDIRECRLVRRLSPKQDAAREVCNEYGFAADLNFHADWVVLERITRLLKCSRRRDNRMRWSTALSKKTFGINLGDTVLFAYNDRIESNLGWSIKYSQFDEVKFKQLVHKSYPSIFPELDYELDGPEWRAAVHEIQSLDH